VSAVLLAWTEVFTRNWALWSIGSTLVIAGLIPGLILRKYVLICFNIFKDTHPPLSMGPRDFEPIEGEEVEFRALDGLRLAGTIAYGHPSKRPRGMIIFAHEFESDKGSFARYCSGLLAAGYDVFSIDFRGHGDSSGEDGYSPRAWVSNREVADMLGAIAFIEDWLEQQGRPNEVGLLGISRGAAAGIIAAASHRDVKAIVTDGLFSSDLALEYLMKRWAYIFAKVRLVYENQPPAFWRLLRRLLFHYCRRRLRCEFPSVRKTLPRMIPRPMLLIHGERDSYIAADHCRYLYALAPQPKYLWIVPGAKHNQAAIVEPAQYAERTVAFFDRHLAGIVATTEVKPLRATGSSA
jgi:pimeloyl-ACP methyl ester carboxylesterase